jgi:hypothetical protein
VGRGGIVYFPWEPDRIGFHFGLRDPMRLIAAAVRATKCRSSELVSIHGVGLIDVSVMDAPGSRVLHLVNFSSAGGVRSGHRRAVEEVIPLHDLAVDLRLPENVQCNDVELAVAGIRAPFAAENGRVRFTIGVLNEFESVLVRYR